MPPAVNSRAPNTTEATPLKQHCHHQRLPYPPNAVDTPSLTKEDQRYCQPLTVSHQTSWTLCPQHYGHCVLDRVGAALPPAADFQTLNSMEAASLTLPPLLTQGRTSANANHQPPWMPGP